MNYGFVLIVHVAILLGNYVSSAAMGLRDAINDARSGSSIECRMSSRGEVHGCVVVSGGGHGGNHSYGRSENHDSGGNLGQTGAIGNGAKCTFYMPDGSVCSETEVINAKVIMGLKKDYAFESGPITTGVAATLMLVINILRNTKLDTGIRPECAKEFVHRTCLMPNKSHYCYKNYPSDPQWIRSPEEQEEVKKLLQDPIWRELMGYEE